MSNNDTPITKEQYQNQFRDKKRALALDRAWKNRDFEIELYWKRAAYFWTFLVAVFGGYFLLLSKGTSVDPVYRLMLSSLGLVFSGAWVLVNIGSKKWQENWEKHIDLLEKEVTGDLYKTVLDKDSYSVSKVNKKVSQFVFCLWCVLSVHATYQIVEPIMDIELLKGIYVDDFAKGYRLVICVIAITLYWLWSLYRSNRKKPRKAISFTRREVVYTGEHSKTDNEK